MAVNVMKGVDISGLERVIAQLSGDERDALDRLIADEVRKPFIPNPGPQTEALHSEADILLYGGQAGGGKSALEVGCPALGHLEGLILRREATQLDGLILFSHEVFGGIGTFNKVDKVWSYNDGCHLKFAGLQHAEDWRKHAGNAKDYMAFDEAGEFLKEQVFSLIGWLRSVKEGQRCRTILGSNPPRGGDGEWMIEEFAPWLDPQNGVRAAYGELLWAIVVVGKTEWVEGPGVYIRAGEEYEAMSRTFIPASLDNNPYLKDTGYRAKLQQLPEPLRSQLLHGDFMAARQDHEWQVIPSDWLELAFQRYDNGVDANQPMDVMGVDVAQGGKDKTVLQPLHGVRFEEPIIRKGEDTRDGAAVGSLIIKERRDNALIVVDATGGWGGDTIGFLSRENSIQVEKCVFSAASGETAKDSRIPFYNLRAQLYWRFREALHPKSGLGLAIKRSAAIKAQLAAHRWKLRAGKILIESKQEIKERTGSSPDEADAIVEALGWKDEAALKKVLKVQSQSRSAPLEDPLADF